MTVAICIRKLEAWGWGLRRRAAAQICGLTCLVAISLGVPAVARSAPAPAGAEEWLPGTGMLLGGDPGSRLPLTMLDLQVDIELTGFMVHATVVQTFKNGTDDTLEGLYVFPLPENAAVHHMEIRIGERRIVSVLQEREAARHTYETARQEGRKAALLQEERPNLFTTSVAGVNPRERVDVRFEYVQELEYSNGAFELLFPLTYTPRYGPNIGSGPVPGEAQAMPPRVELLVRLRGGLPVEEPLSDSHPISWRWDNSDLLIEPRSTGSMATDRDFHLRFVPQVGHQPEAAVFTEEREGSLYSLLMVLPPPEGEQQSGLATATLFVIDISGSMNGTSIVQARAALAAAVHRLHPDDTFNILAFNNQVRAFAGDYVEAGEVAKSGALHWIRSLTASGGTRIDLALEAALDLVQKDETWRVERLIFMTDGAVSTEEALLGSIGSRLGPARLHTLGIGAAPNRYLMRQMAAAGRGLCAFISRVDQAENDIDLFLARLARPVMTDISLRWEGATPLEAYPRRLPDLHAGEPLVVSARFDQAATPGRLVLQGNVGGTTIHRVLDAGSTGGATTGIATRWARHKVGELMDSLHKGADPAAVRQAVIAVSLRFGIVTRYTSLVAVEENPSAAGESRRVRVRSSLPASGQLPMGGTVAPLLHLLMILCALSAGLAGLAGRALRHRRQQVG